jgi:hypothetical protein
VRSDAEIRLELAEIGFDLVVHDRVDHLAVLDHVVSVGDGRGEDVGVVVHEPHPAAYVVEREPAQVGPAQRDLASDRVDELAMRLLKVLEKEKSRNNHTLARVA